MPGSYCSAIGCKNSTREKKLPDITFHRFPVDPATRFKWIEFIRRANWDLPKHHLLCSEHFKKEDFRIYSEIPSWINDLSGHKSKLTLKKGAVPSVEVSSNFVLPKR